MSVWLPDRNHLFLYLLQTQNSTRRKTAHEKKIIDFWLDFPTFGQLLLKFFLV